MSKKNKKPMTTTRNRDKAKPTQQPKKQMFSETEMAEIRKTALDDPQKARNQLAMLARIHKAESYRVDAIQSSKNRIIPKRHTESLDNELWHDFSRDILIATSRDLDLNFSLVSGLVETHLDYVVGKGPTLIVNTADKEWNERCLKAFETWTKNCDVRGLMNFGMMVRQTERGRIVDGDSGLALVRGRKLQAIEGDLIRDNEQSAKDGNQLVNGVEMNDVGRAVAYHIYKRSGKIQSTQKTFQRRINAESFILHFASKRFDQSRGMPALTSNINNLQDMKEIMEAVKGTVKMENILSMFIQSDAPQGDFDLLGDIEKVFEQGNTGNEHERNEVKIDQGINIIDLLPGESVNAVKKETPGGTFETFFLMLMRIIGKGLGMPLEVALSLFTRGTYAGHRSAFLNYFKSIDHQRDVLEFKVLSRVFKWWVSSSIAEYNRTSGESGLKPPSVEGVQPWDHEWQFPGLPMLDPQKERLADAMGLKLGAETLERIAIRGGTNWEKNMEQRGREIEKAIEISGGKYPFTLLSQPFDPGAAMLTEDDGTGEEPDGKSEPES